MSPADQQGVKRPLNNSHLVFPCFSKLPTEIRLTIWDLASPGIIDVYCDKNGFEYVKPHPFRHACCESRQFYTRGATYLKGTNGLRDTELAKVPFHFDRDYFRLYSLDKYKFPVYPYPFTGNRHFKQLRKIILPPASLRFTGHILRGDIVEIRACLTDIPDHLILPPSSAFRRACPFCPCERWPTSYYTTYDSSRSDSFLHRIEQSDRARRISHGISTFAEPCPSCPWARQIHEAGICNNIFQELSTWHSMMDKDLPQRPSVQQIKKASIPMLLFEQPLDSSIRLKHEKPRLYEMYSRLDFQGWWADLTKEELEAEDNMELGCVSGSCIH